MIKITLKDGSVKEFEKGLSVLDIAKQISKGLARNTAGATIDGKLVDIRTIITSDCNLNLITIDSKEGLKILRHTSAHIMAQAVKRLFPDAKMAIGPAIEDGFYYDFDHKPFSSDELLKIEEEMKNIVKEDLPIERFTLSKKDALDFLKKQDEPYKIEIVNDLKEDDTISFYKQGEFVDLCAGPHLTSTKYAKAIKILNQDGSSGAYWKGNEKNKMLARIYATAFTKASHLEEFLTQREEAKKRDHNKLGRELSLFTTSDTIGQGLPLLMPKGARIIQILQRFVEDEEYKRGYVLTKTPFLAKSDLYKISGHWQHYKEDMFVLGDEDKDNEVFALRPMTCPFQYSIYNATSHSYRDLPVRFAETSTLFRNEASGEMHGLIRLRQFTISEGHIVCTKEQLGEEFKQVVDLINFMMKTFGIDKDVTYRFSKWDPNNTEKYSGSKEQWEETQSIMRTLLNELKLDFTEAEGEAAFYGPKLDIQFKNVHGKEDTIITVQIDFLNAKLFDMTYIDKDNTKQHPVIIHRTSLGCYERTLAMLIEKYAGNFPTWLAPIQAIVLPISSKFNSYADQIANTLQNNGIRIEKDLRDEKIGYKIREARLERIPYLIIVGEQEVLNNEISVKNRGNDLGNMSIDLFLDKINEDINNKLIV